MKTYRSPVGLLVNELIAEGLVFEGAKGVAKRGRKPKFLYIDSRGRSVVAVDVRASRTFIMLTDALGREFAGIASFPTPREPHELVIQLAHRIKSVLREHEEMGACQGVGVVVPGMVDRETSRILQAPTLGWQDIDLQGPLAAAVDFPVYLENSGRACVLAQMWAGQDSASGGIVFVNVSDGIAVGSIVNGELLRGRHNVASEFGHVVVNTDGPRCSCGARGCWETYVSNLATLSRYFGRSPSDGAPVPNSEMTIDDLIARARSGQDTNAMAALQSTANYLGVGLGSIINVLGPERVYISGEIVGAWDLIEAAVNRNMKGNVLGPAREHSKLHVVPVSDYPRLRGAATLVVMAVFDSAGRMRIRRPAEVAGA
jgi:predicted NBD/HSP70 family sugar kinase